MRISDWSSDVCSSDLRRAHALRRKLAQFHGLDLAVAGDRHFVLAQDQHAPRNLVAGHALLQERADRRFIERDAGLRDDAAPAHFAQGFVRPAAIGRASGREMEWPYV